MLYTKNILRLLVYLIGVSLLALGGVFAIKSRLGVSPVNILPLSFSYSTGLSLGLASFIIFCVYVVGQIIILKKDFNPIQFFQIIFAILFGQFINFFNSNIQIENISIIIRIWLCIIGILLVAIGIFLTVTPKLVPLAPDGMAQAIGIKLKADFGKGKMVFDIIIVSTSIILLFLSSSGFQDIGIGTILSVALVGKIVSILNQHFKTRLEKILF